MQVLRTKYFDSQDEAIWYVNKATKLFCKIISIESLQGGGVRVWYWGENRDWLDETIGAVTYGPNHYDTTGKPDDARQGPYVPKIP